LLDAPFRGHINIGQNGETFLFKRKNRSRIESLLHEGWELTIQTNGMALRPDDAIWLIHPKIRRIMISIDGCSDSVFEWVRNGAKLSHIKSVIQALYAERNNKCMEKPLLTTNFTILRQNICELSDVVELAADLGISIITTTHVVLTRDRDRRQSMLLDVTSRRTANYYVALAEKKARDLGIFLRPSYCDIPTNSDKKDNCVIPFHAISIFANGNVAGCFSHIVGSLWDSTIEQIWNSEAMKSLREHRKCKGCTYCATRNPDALEDYGLSD